MNAYTRLVVTKEYRAIARNQDGTPEPRGDEGAASAAHPLRLSGRVLGRVLRRCLDPRAGRVAGAQAAASRAPVRSSWCSTSRACRIGCSRCRRARSRSSTTASPVSPHPDHWRREIDLDYPTFFYEALGGDLLQAYSDSPIGRRCRRRWRTRGFTNDVRRVIKRPCTPRLTATIQSDEFIKSLPSEISGDPEKLDAFREQLISASRPRSTGSTRTTRWSLRHHQVRLPAPRQRGLERGVGHPAEHHELEGGERHEGAGLGAGSLHRQSEHRFDGDDAVREVLPGVQLKVNSISQPGAGAGGAPAGTTAMSSSSSTGLICGPTANSEAFYSMRQSRILDLLSIGYVSDEAAAIELIGRLPPEGAQAERHVLPGGQSGSPCGRTPSNTSALNRDLTPPTPASPKGRQRMAAPPAKALRAVV